MEGAQAPVRKPVSPQACPALAEAAPCPPLGHAAHGRWGSGRCPSEAEAIQQAWICRLAALARVPLPLRATEAQGGQGGMGYWGWGDDPDTCPQR